MGQRTEDSGMVYICDGGFANPICEFANCELKVLIVAKNANLRICESPNAGTHVYSIPQFPFFIFFA